MGMPKRPELDFDLEIKDLDSSGRIKGIASTFGGAPDSGGDVVEQGAFLKTISQGGRNRNGIGFLWAHHSDEPLGVWNELKEASKGLLVDGQFAMETQIGKEKHALAQMGAVKGLSIGFTVVKEEIDRGTRVRTLKELSLWEISLVTFPMNTRARITSVKDIEDAKSPKELEHVLREAGLSKSSALYVVKLCRPSLSESGKVDCQQPAMVELLKTLRETREVIRR